MQLHRLPQNAESDVRQRVEAKVAKLEKRRNDLYIGENGIGRRRKTQQQAETEHVAATAHIQRGLTMVQNGLARINHARNDLPSVASSSTTELERRPAPTSQATTSSASATQATPTSETASTSQSATPPRECPICLETIDATDVVKTSFCTPVAHVMRQRCWRRIPEDQRHRCVVCRQQELNLGRAMRIYCKYPTSSRTFDPSAFLREPSLQWFNYMGEGIAKSFVRREIDEYELWRLTIRARVTSEDHDKYAACLRAVRRLADHSLEMEFTSL